MSVQVNIFNRKNPELNNFSDEFLLLIKKLREIEIPSDSMIKSAPLENILTLSVNEAYSLLENNGFDIFTSDYQRMQNEIYNLIDQCYKFYCVDSLAALISEYNLCSVQDVAYNIIKWEIRLKRMLMLLKPEYNVTDGFNKRTEKKYRMLKAYWIDEDGTRKRCFNKNVGITEGEIEFHYERFLKNIGYDVTWNVKLPNGIRPDLIIEKDGKRTVVELKVRNKEQFYSRFLNLEMWYKYCEIYNVV